MNVFEDLVVELKEANLLEETMFDRPSAVDNGHGGLVTHEDFALADGDDWTAEFSDHSESTSSTVAERLPVGNIDAVRSKLAENIAALQLAEFVITSAEELLGKHCSTFDDLAIKKAFHHYSRACDDPESEECFESEVALHEVIDAWESDLAERDDAIPPTAIRWYIENASPPLSPQALFALIRFYLSGTYSASAISKFDFVVTRLFSKFVDGLRRETICSRKEIVRHLRMRYAQWGIETTDHLHTDDPDVSLAIQMLDDFAGEAANAASLLEFASNTLLERLVEFKQNAKSLLLVPEAAAAMIECNLSVATKVIDLLGPAGPQSLGLAGLDAVLLSEAVARSFESGDDAVQVDETESEDETASTERPSGRKPRPVKAKKKQAAKARAFTGSLFGINKWLLIATMVTLVLSVGIYVWAEYFASEPVSGVGVRVVDLEKPELKQYVKTTKVSGNMLYAVITPAYERLEPAKKREFLDAVRREGEQKGFSRVSLLNTQGKAVGFASDERIDLP